MKHLLTSLVLALVAASCLAHGAPGRLVAPPPALAVASPPTAPPAGVSELKFGEIFKMPVGPYGLEPSVKLLSLDGKPVRMVGYMASAELPTPGVLILTPLPVVLGDESCSSSSVRSPSAAPSEPGHAVLRSG